MIFVTVGHQMPFDRMVRLVDQWAANNPETEVFAQTGATDYRPVNIDSAQLLSRDEFAARMQNSAAIVAHAGTGTIIDALLLNKPLLVMPRLARYAETRNDHQIGTARHFAEQGQILAAFDDETFTAQLDQLANFRPARDIGSVASPELLQRLQGFINA